MKELLELIENLAGISITACDSGDVIVSCCSLSFDTSSHFVQRLEKHLKSSHHTKTVPGGWSLKGKGTVSEPWLINEPKGIGEYR